jgi:hypothetical protein
MSEIFTHPRAVRRLPNGTEVDEHGHFLTGPSAEHLPIQSSEDARELAVRKHSLARERAREGLLQAARERGLAVASADDAWREVIAVRAGVALDKAGRDSNDATRLVGKATGYLSEREEEEGEDRPKRLGPKDVEALLRLAHELDNEIERRTDARMRARRVQVIDGEIDE